MRRSTLFLFLYALLAFQLPLEASAGTVVKLTRAEGRPAALAIASRTGKAESKEEAPTGWRYLPAVDLYIVEEEGRNRLNRLQKDGAVEAAEDGLDVRLEALPNDPLLKDQGWASEKDIDVGALEAWGLLDGGERVTVAVIDTGIDTAHPDLAPNLWTNGGEIPGNGKDDDGNGYIDDVNGYNFWDHSGDVTDENDHGSHLAGIIGAVGDNGLGVAGVDWNARLMALRFTDERGNGTSTKAIESIDYAIRNGAKIINASWTLKLDGEAKGTQSDLLRQAIQKASEAGVLFVTASGNQFQTDEGLDVDRSPVYPAAYRTANMVSVAAADAKGDLASYSNFGMATVDLAAPGASILSTSADAGYLSMSGTSMAAAFVSGAAALVYSINPDLTAAQVKAVLDNAVAPSASLEGKVLTGGMINLHEAVSIVQSGSIPDAPVASVSSRPSDTTSNDFTPPPGGCSLVK